MDNSLLLICSAACGVALYVWYRRAYPKLKIASGDVGGVSGQGMEPEEAKKLYDEWGDGYTASVESWGYTMPHEIATRLANCALASGGQSLAVLDAGAGDGLSGIELRKAGFRKSFTTITGADLSSRLLEIAASRGCYDCVQETNLMQPLAFKTGAFDVVSCVGTLTYLAPACGVLAEFVRVCKPGGYVSYNLRTDHEAAWQGAQQALTDAKSWTLLEKSEPLPYLPNNPDYGDKVLTVIYTWRTAL